MQIYTNRQHIIKVNCLTPKITTTTITACSDSFPENNSNAWAMFDNHVADSGDTGITNIFDESTNQEYVFAPVQIHGYMK